ncbi:MAG: right-handed parallel beta-helix repeat-containing protein, partial [Bacteroidales bacterium]|nr:right-handed parallel beta-helix repeat-containing protein [Bacteroidales bacterium]
NINITKPVKIYGGYSTDFSTRDVLKYLTMVQPSPESNGTQNGQGTMQIQVKTANTEVVIDGLIFDRGNSIAYNSKGEGKPAGVESAMMQPIGGAGLGGPNLTQEQVLTTQTAQIYLDNSKCNLTVNNCAFINAPNYGIRGMFGGTKAVINNCIFINNRMAACEITKGGAISEKAEVHFTYNTVLFMWSRLKDMEDMGYGYRYMTGINSYVTNNIIGLTTFAGLDRGRIDSDRNKEAQRITTAEHNIFFLNKQADLTIPGGGKFMRIWVQDFEDVEQLAEVDGNKTLTDPKVFKGIINEAYLNGFLAASYKETTSHDPNSSANQFRQAMGMNMTGTMTSSASMYANRYPWKEALLFFGAIDGYGAQKIK